MRLVAEREYRAASITIKVAQETGRSSPSGIRVPQLTGRLETLTDVAVSFNGSWVLVSTSGNDATSSVYPADAVDSITGLREPNAQLY